MTLTHADTTNARHPHTAGTHAAPAAQAEGTAAPVTSTGRGGRTAPTSQPNFPICWPCCRFGSE